MLIVAWEANRASLFYVDATVQFRDNLRGVRKVTIGITDLTLNFDLKSDKSTRWT